MREIHFTYLGGPDIEALAMTDDEILGAVEEGLRAQGSGQAVMRDDRKGVNYGASDPRADGQAIAEMP